MWYYFVNGTGKKNIFEGTVKLGTQGGETGLNGTLRYDAVNHKFQGYANGV